MTDPTGDAGFPVIDLPPEADSPEAAVRLLLEELVRAGSVPAEEAAALAQQVWRRERLGSTGIGRGVAIPQAQFPLAGGPAGVVGRCPRPLDWPDTLDGEPVGVVCLVVAPAGPAGPQFRMLLERVIRQFSSG